MCMDGQIQVVFLVKGPIYLVCISCTDETYEYLRGQLDLLYGQVTSDFCCSVSFVLKLSRVEMMKCNVTDADDTHFNKFNRQMF